MSSRRAVLGGSPALIGIVVAVLVLTAGGFLASQYSRPLPEVAAPGATSFPGDSRLPCAGRHLQPGSPGGLLETPVAPPEAVAQQPLDAERVTGTAPALPWPGKGSAAVYVDDFGFLGTHGDEAPRPIGSTAKIMTALLTLEDHPLALGQPGPEVTITQQDVADYLAAVKQDESVVPVRAGEKLNELQLLQGLMLPSGNNVADVLAKWDAGSKDAFIAKMNARVAALGMTHTHYDDASGFSPKTVSTPSDLLILGAKAMTDPVFRQTVATVQTILPYVGVVKNVNTMLGKDGNIGIKTGSTDEAGGCFVSASTQKVAGKQMEVYSAVLGMDNLDEALKATTDLSNAAAASFGQSKVISRGDVAATPTPAQGDPVDVVPNQDYDHQGVYGHRQRIQAPAKDHPWRHMPIGRPR